jgi:hypothetical protein
VLSVIYHPEVFMSLDYDRQKRKKDDLESAFASLLLSEGADEQESEIIAKELLPQITRITPPEKENKTLELISATSYSGAGGGKSAKSGNIRLNLTQLFGGLASGSLVVSGISGSVAPWMLVAAAISFWASIRGVTQVNVTENDVGVIWTLWKMRDGQGIVRESEQEILLATNEHLKKYGRSPVGIADIKAALAHLKEIRSIKPAKGGGWFIVEWVRVLYR